MCVLIRCDDVRSFASDPVAVVVACRLSISTSCVSSEDINAPGTAPAVTVPRTFDRCCDKRKKKKEIERERERKKEEGRKVGNGWSQQSQVYSACSIVICDYIRK